MVVVDPRMVLINTSVAPESSLGSYTRTNPIPNKDPNKDRKVEELKLKHDYVVVVVKHV